MSARAWVGGRLRRLAGASAAVHRRFSLAARAALGTVAPARPPRRDGPGLPAS